MMKTILRSLLIGILSLWPGVCWCDDIIAQQTSHPNGFAMNDSIYNGFGQSFTCGVAGKKITSVSFYLARTGSPGGTVAAKMYAVTGTVGTNAKPTGGALATSDTQNVNDLSTSMTLVSFTFSGANQITLSNGTGYSVVFEVSTMDASNYLTLQLDETDVDAAQNRCYNISGTWSGNNTADIAFVLYGVNAAGGGTPTTLGVATPAAVDGVTGASKVLGVP